jgi:hypothetical protein
MHTGGRSKHLKVVVVSLLCAIVFALVGLTARLDKMNGAGMTGRIDASGPVMPARTPKTMTSNVQSTIR